MLALALFASVAKCCALELVLQTVYLAPLVAPAIDFEALAKH
jgi:hypothetical protein